MYQLIYLSVSYLDCHLSYQWEKLNLQSLSCHILIGVLYCYLLAGLAPLKLVVWFTHKSCMWKPRRWVTEIFLFGCRWKWAPQTKPGEMSHGWPLCPWTDPSIRSPSVTQNSSHRAQACEMPTAPFIVGTENTVFHQWTNKIQFQGRKPGSISCSSPGVKIFCNSFTHIIGPTKTAKDSCTFASLLLPFQISWYDTASGKKSHD